MKFLLDVNMPPVLVEALAKHGHVARHAALIGLPKAADIELLDLARQHGETIITHDLDFGQLLSFSGQHFPSVIIFRIHQINAKRFEVLLLAHWSLIEEPLSNGALIVIEEEKVRVRKLPI